MQRRWWGPLMTCVAAAACASESEPPRTSGAAASAAELQTVPSESASAPQQSGLREAPEPAPGQAHLAVTPPSGSAGHPVVVLRTDVVDGFYARTRPFADVSRWLGLYGDDAEGWALRTVEISWTTTPDSEPDEDVALHEMSTTPESPLLLFGDVAGLEPGPVETIARYGASLGSSAPEASFSLGDQRYLVRLSTSDGMGCDGVVALTDGSATQDLYVASEDVVSCGEPHYAVNWAGDLDLDGRLDLVGTFSPKYSAHTRRLYLSSAAEPGELVGLRAMHDGGA